MDEYQQLQDTYGSIVRLIAVVMLINLLWSFFSLFLGDILVGPREDEEGSMGALVCVIAWMVSLVMSLVALVMVAVWKSETGATMGLIFGWPLALTIPLVVGSLPWIVLSSIAPIFLSMLVIRMLRMAFLLEWKRPPPPQVDYPVAPPKYPDGREPPDLRLYK